MGKIKYIPGQRIGECTYVSDVSDKRRRHLMMVCSCGKQFTAAADKLVSGHTKSCGCKKNLGTQRIFLTEGKTYGRLTFLRETIVDGVRRGLFKCACGAKVINRLDAVASGHATSCGCYHKDVVAEMKLRHGHARNSGVSLTYRSWKCMRSRVTDPMHPNYQRYKALGVTICDEWDDFAMFLKDMGERPTRKLTLERIDNLKGYYKENCRWATRKEQSANREVTCFVMYKSENKPLTEWASLLGFNPDLLYYRLHDAKWSVEKAFTTPVKIQNKKTTISCQAQQEVQY